MAGEQIYINCRKWYDPSCPHYLNDHMLKTYFRNYLPRVKLNALEHKQVESLCSACNEFAEEPNRRA